jgi:hypothetical protein
MYGRRALTVVAIALAAITMAKSGHELPVYPSYYPHEIELVAVAPDRAADMLLSGKLHAYVGSAPRFSGPLPDTISSIDSLGAFVIVRVNRASPAPKDGRSACALADGVIRAFAGKSSNVILHPYPVTPFHGDYLHHVDLAEAAVARLAGSGADSAGAVAGNLRVKVSGGLAEDLVRPEWRAQGSEWDAEVTAVEAAQLVASTRQSMNGWLGPAWLRAGWLHAYLLLNGQTGNDDLKRRVESSFRRLEAVAYDDAVERINLERSLVTALASGCDTRVAGYTVKREYFSTVFTAGIENISYDAVEGFNAPMFIRTVKLKDFPWNGWLTLGVDSPPATAWNPIAGFTDDFGRLMWSAVGDPALIPSPYESAWMLNRITDVQSGSRR